MFSVYLIHCTLELNSSNHSFGASECLTTCKLATKLKAELILLLNSHSAGCSVQRVLCVVSASLVLANYPNIIRVTSTAAN